MSPITRAIVDVSTSLGSGWEVAPMTSFVSGWEHSLQIGSTSTFVAGVSCEDVEE